MDIMLSYGQSGKRIAKELYNSLTYAQKKLSYELVLDLLPEKLKENSGYFFSRLLEREGLTVSNLTDYIWGYIECIVNCDTMENVILTDRNSISSALNAMEKAHSVTKKNIYIDYICDFFSVSESVLRFGIGKKYTINMDKVAKIFDKSELSEQDFLEQIFEKFCEVDDKIKDDCDYYIRHSHVVFGKIIENTFFENNVLIEENYSLLDTDSFIEYWGKLEQKEKNAVYRFMENIKKELGNQ